MRITAGEFWCVWDNHMCAEAFGGQLTYLAHSVALDKAAALNRSATG